MSITYKETTAGIRPKDLAGFFVGWPNRPSPDAHLRILEGSDLIVLAVAPNSGVVGFVTAITDGVASAHITFLEVLPDWQGRGIGTELMRSLLAGLKGIYAIDLVCDEDVRGFYERLGFNPALAMTIRNQTTAY